MGLHFIGKYRYDYSTVMIEELDIRTAKFRNIDPVMFVNLFYRIFQRFK